MGNIVPLLRKTAGLNNKLSSVRMHPDVSSGVVGLSTAVNIEYDTTGMPRRRNGKSSVVGGVCRDVFGNGDHGFVVLDNCLYVIKPDKSLVKIRSNLTGVKTYYCRTNQGVYYSNGVENGVIRNFLSYPWPVQKYFGPPDSVEYSPAPVGKHLAIYNGRMLISVGRYLYYSEPHSFGLFNLALNLPFKSDITMVKPTTHGVYVSDSESVFFLRGEDINAIDFEQVESQPAIDGSCVQKQIRGTDLGMDDPSYQWVWFSSTGFIAGNQVGVTKNLVYDTFSPPVMGNRGAGVFTGSSIIQCIF